MHITQAHNITAVKANLPDRAKALEETLVMNSGHTPREMARRFTAAGILAPTGKPLTVPELRTALAEPFRAGLLRYSGKVLRRLRPRWIFETATNAQPHGGS